MYNNLSNEIQTVRNRKHATVYIALALLLLLALALFSFRQANALVQYPPAALLQPGDITSSMIRAKAVTAGKIDDTANILWTQIETATTAPITLGLGSSTPSQTLSVKGGIYADSGITASNVTATSTLTLGKQTLNVPSTAGTSGQSLQVASGGTSLVWQGAGGLTLLGEVQNTAASSTMAVGGLGAYDHLRVLFFSSGASAANGGRIRFNGIMTAQYGFRQSADIGADTITDNTATVSLCSGTNASELGVEIEITATSTSKKLFMSHCNEAGTGAVHPEEVETYGVWNNTTNPINEISISTAATSTQTWNAGSYIKVYGYQN